MFSTLSSFLPAALHGPSDRSPPASPAAQPPQASPPEQPEQQHRHDAQNAMPADEQAQRKKRERTHEVRLSFRPHPQPVVHEQHRTSIGARAVSVSFLWS